MACWALSGKACFYKERPVRHIKVRSTHILKGFLMFLFQSFSVLVSIIASGNHLQGFSAKRCVLL